MSQPVLQFSPTGPRDNLARRTAHGFFWLMAQTIGSKLVGLAGQVVLAWLLMPEDLGLWGAATVIAGFCGLIQQAGIRETLIQRQEKYHLWANSAFWMSAALGCVGAVVTAAVAWPAAALFHQPQLVGLILVLAATAPVQSLDLVAEARLQLNLRFAMLATVNWAITVSQLILTVIFAKLGFGAYSFVLPRPITAVARLILLWWAAKPPVTWRPEVRRWKYLVSDSATLFVSNIFLQLQLQGDNIVLGFLYADKAVLGVYFFAFNLSINTMALFTGNLTGVLFPALSKLQGDPKRQIRAFLDATQALALIAVPLCILQAAAADPGIRLLFQDDKWSSAIPVLQALSLGMAFRVVASPGGSLIQAQGRFKVILITNILNVAFFLPLVTAGGLVGDLKSADLWLRPATTVGIAVAVYFVIVAPIFLYVAIRPSGGTLADLWRVYARPMLASLVAGAVSMGLGALIPADKVRGHRWAQGIRLVSITVWFVVIYVPLIRYLAPEAWRALIQRLVTLYRGRAAELADEPKTPLPSATSPQATP